MIQKPTISIVVPSLNQGIYLEECLESLFAQEYPDLEIMVFDGGSTDGSIRIIKDYSDRLSYWQSRPDGGQTKAINLGFKRARSKYVAWLNSDDYLTFGSLEKSVDAMERNPSAGIVCGALRIVHENGREIAIRRSGGDLSSNNLLNRNRSVNQPGSLIRRNTLESVGFLDESYNYAMDYDLWVRISKVSPIVQVSEIVAAHRMHAMSKTVSNYVAFLPEIARVRRKNGARTVSIKSLNIARVHLGLLRRRLIGR